MMAYVQGLHKNPSQWTFGGIPLPSLLRQEERKGVLKPVIEKALVNLQSAPFTRFQFHRSAWKSHSAYQNPGPIQFEGSPDLTDSFPLILQ